MAFKCNRERSHERQRVNLYFKFNLWLEYDMGLCYVEMYT